MLLALLVVRTMLQLGPHPGSYSSMRTCYKMMSGCGPILPILSGNGVKHHTRSEFVELYSMWFE